MIIYDADLGQAVTGRIYENYMVTPHTAHATLHVVGTTPKAVMLCHTLSALHRMQSCCAIRCRYYATCSNALPQVVGTTPDAVILCHTLWVLYQMQSCCAVSCRHNTKCCHAVQYVDGTTPHAVMLCHTLSALHQTQSCCADGNTRAA